MVLLLDFLKKQAEKKLGVDLDGDGVIGSGKHLSLNARRLCWCSKKGRSGHGGTGGVMNQVEKATHMDLNGDGRIGVGAGHGQQVNHGGGAGHGQQINHGGGAHGGGARGSGGLAGSVMNQVEKATKMDLNGDGRIGGGARPHHWGGKHRNPCSLAHDCTNFIYLFF